MLTQLFRSVLSPAPFDRASLNPYAPASQRLAFPNASAVSVLPFSSVVNPFFGDQMTYTTTPRLLQTVAAVATPRGNANVTTSRSAMPTATETGIVPFTGAGTGLLPGASIALAVAVGAAALIV